MSSVYPHTEAVGLVTCWPCAAGRFKSLGGSGTPDTCESVSTWSVIAFRCNCVHKLLAWHVQKLRDVGVCLLPSLVSLVLVFGLTMCQQCADGSYSSTEQQTACDRCLEGSTLVSQDEGCQQCSPGYFRSTLMTNCSSCDAGRFQNTSGQSECTKCSAVLDLQGPNPHLWDDHEQD